MRRLAFATFGLLLVGLADVASAQSSVRGLVIGSDGSSRPAVVVRLTGAPAAADAQPTVRSQLTDASGNYQFENLPAGSYELSADVPLAAPGEVANSGSFTLDANQAVVRNLIVAPPSWSDRQARRSLAVTVTVAAIYLLLILLYRFYNIIAPTRALLEAQIDSVRIRLAMEADPAQSAEVTTLSADLAQIREELGTVSWGSTLFWSRGEEIAAWSRIHEIERQLATFLSPLPRVLERVQTAEAELRVRGTPPAIALADRIRVNLVALTADPDPPRAPQAVESLLRLLKHELAEALAMIYDERDTGFASLMEWQNKAMWLSTVAILVIVVLGLVFDHEWLFLVGAAGGLMSRLARTLFREDLPTDYGASWTTLFMSPLVGAIGAWFGILLIAALVAAGVLGPLMARVNWPPHFDALTIALAFTLGFSERLFTTLVSTVEGQVKPNRVPTPPAPPTPGLGGGAGAAPLDSGPGGGGGAGSSDPNPGGGGASEVTAAPAAVQRLDLIPGERAALLGDAESPARQKIAGIVGAGNVFAVDLAQLGTVAPLDAVLVEKLPEAAQLEAAAVTIHDALAPNGRVVVVGSTPAGLFEAEAETMRTQNVAGPALVHEAMTKAGLLAQEPPERLDGPDPVRWVSAFARPLSAQAGG